MGPGWLRRAHGVRLSPSAPGATRLLWFLVPGTEDQDREQSVRGQMWIWDGGEGQGPPGSPQCRSWCTSQQLSQDRCRPIQSRCSCVILAGGAAWRQRHGVMCGSQLHPTHLYPFPPITLGPRSRPTPPPKLRGLCHSTPRNPWLSLGWGLGWGGEV